MSRTTPITNAQRREMHLERISARRVSTPTPPSSVLMDGIVLGFRDDVPVFATPSIMRTHAEIVGATGGGKSVALLHLIKQYRKHGYGGLVIDPHGSLAAAVVADEVAYRPHLGSGLRVIDVNADSIQPVNLLHCPPGVEPVVVADRLVDTLAQHRDEDPHDHPTTLTTMRAVFTAVAELGGTLLDVPPLLEPDPATSTRAAVITKLRPGFAREAIERLHQKCLDPKLAREFEIATIGTLNRIMSFLAYPSIAAMVGQSGAGLDFATVMDAGELIVVNASPGPRASDAAQQALVALLLNNVVDAMQRRSNRTLPFAIIIDEAPRYMTGDIARILNESRKFACLFHLAYQYREQMSDEFRAALRSGARVKIVFAVASHRDAEELALDVMPIDEMFEMPKESMIRPTVVGQRIRLMKSSSETESATQQVADAFGDAVSETDIISSMKVRGSTSVNTLNTNSGAGQSLTPLTDLGWGELPVVLGEQQFTSSGNGKARGEQESEGDGSAHGSGRTRSHIHVEGFGAGRAKTRGEQEALESVYEDLPTVLHSRDEIIHKCARLLRTLPTGKAFVAFRDVAAIITVPNVEQRVLAPDAARRLINLTAGLSPDAVPLMTALHRLSPIVTREKSSEVDAAVPEPMPPKTKRRRRD